MKKSYEEINEKIRQGKAVVLTAEEVSQLARTLSPAEIVRRVDVVTTGTFGAMCSSGAFLNFGHATPPIRMERIELNGVPVSGGLAAVDTFVGATDCDPARPAYGGAHVIEELVAGRSVTLEPGQGNRRLSAAPYPLARHARRHQRGDPLQPAQLLPELQRRDQLFGADAPDPYGNAAAQTAAMFRTAPQASCRPCSTIPRAVRSAWARASSSAAHAAT